MNATFLKVLKEVLLGLPITEPIVKRGNKIRRRRPESKRVPSHSRFALGCHAQSIKERERKRKKETEHNHNLEIGMKENVCMKYA